MKREVVQEFVEEADSIIQSSPQMNEANTKAAILRDFIELLGWEIPTNTKLEYPVKAFGQTYNVDYALILEGAPVAFLEAKGSDKALTADHEEQLSSYMMNKNVNYGMLSNGVNYRFFQRQVDASNVSVQRVGNVELQNLPGKLPVLRAFTVDAIASGDADEILGQINELRRARTALEAKKDQFAAELTDYLTNNVSDSISTIAEPQFKETIDRIIEGIDDEIDAEAAEPPTGARTDTTIKPRKNLVAGKISRRDIEGDDSARVAVFPTKPSGIPFLIENNAWGFVRVGQEFDYIAMYASREGGEIRYFATVEDVVPPDEADLERPPTDYVDRAKIGEGKMVVRFEPDSLFELEDPIPRETKWPQSLQYTTLGALRTADTTDDVL